MPAAVLRTLNISSRLLKYISLTCRTCVVSNLSCHYYSYLISLFVFFLHHVQADLLEVLQEYPEAKSLLERKAEETLKRYGSTEETEDEVRIIIIIIHKIFIILQIKQKAWAYALKILGDLFIHLAVHIFYLTVAGTNINYYFYFLGY